MLRVGFVVDELTHRESHRELARAVPVGFQNSGMMNNTGVDKKKRPSIYKSRNLLTRKRRRPTISYLDTCCVFIEIFLLEESRETLGVLFELYINRGQSRHHRRRQRVGRVHVRDFVPVAFGLRPRPGHLQRLRERALRRHSKSTDRCSSNISG